MKIEAELKQDILKTLKAQNGILFAEPAIVWRENFSGRDVIAKNSRFIDEYTDERGYVPVEWWVTSTTAADSQIEKKDEGLTNIRLVSGESVLLKKAAQVAEKELFGSYRSSWPLVKILDIGGQPVVPSFSGQAEVPPIPVHVHSGDIIDARAVGPGKVEAYFFPPVNVPPHNKDFGRTITRIGLKADVTKEEFKKRMARFAKDDSMYELLRVYDISPYTSWTIPEGMIHAPGPWVTFEIQIPKDDWNLASWRMGERAEDPELYGYKVLRGLKDEDDFLSQLVDWNLCIDPGFEEKYFRDVELLDKGEWGRRYRIFFHRFYGEGWEIEAGKSVTFPAKDKPVGAIVWSGAGSLNGSEISNPGNREFFIAPGTDVRLDSFAEGTQGSAGHAGGRLMIFTVEPMQD